MYQKVPGRLVQDRCSWPDKVDTVFQQTLLEHQWWRIHLWILKDDWPVEPGQRHSQNASPQSDLNLSYWNLFHLVIVTSFHSRLDGRWIELMSGVWYLRDKLVKVGGRAILQTSFSSHSFTMAPNNACTQLSHHIPYLSKVPCSMIDRQSFFWSKLRRNRQPRWWPPYHGHDWLRLSKWRPLHDSIEWWSGHLWPRVGQISLQELSSSTKTGSNHLTHLEKVKVNWMMTLIKTHFLTNHRIYFDDKQRMATGMPPVKTANPLGCFGWTNSNSCEYSILITTENKISLVI